MPEVEAKALWLLAVLRVVRAPGWYFGDFDRFVLPFVDPAAADTDGQDGPSGGTAELQHGSQH